MFFLNYLILFGLCVALLGVWSWLSYYNLQNNRYLPTSQAFRNVAVSDTVAPGRWTNVPFIVIGLDFIRAEGFVFSHVADEGLLNACAGDLLRYRKQIGAEHVEIFTDIKKKHRWASTKKIIPIRTHRRAHLHTLPVIYCLFKHVVRYVAYNGSDCKLEILQTSVVKLQEHSFAHLFLFSIVWANTIELKHTISINRIRDSEFRAVPILYFHFTNTMQIFCSVEC